MWFIGMNKLIRRTEELILSLLLTAMIVLSCLQIILRQFFDSGLPWADPLLRYLVVWGGFLGAVLAVSMGKHIALDILSNFLSPTVKRSATVVTKLFSAIVCGFLTYASWLFLLDEMQFGSTPLLTIPSWCWNLIFPIAFAAMTLRYSIGTVIAVYRLKRPRPDSTKATIQ
jgi:TRAP-type C4-dicarboxylate transport system permease small subunit